MAGVLRELLKKLSYLAGQQIVLAWGVEGDLKKLQNYLFVIQTKLQKADHEKLEENNWVKRLWDVVYEAEDVLDEFSYEAERRKFELLNLMGKVCNFFSSSNPLVFRLKMAHKIQNVKAKFDEIVEDMKKFKVFTDELIAPAADHLNCKNNGRETISTVNHSEIVGRDEDKKKLVAMLIDPGNNQDDRSLSVIPIVGIGGLGKTTLAQLVYNDEQVETHFVDLKMWICVSDDDFNAKKLLGDIIESTKGSISRDASSLEMKAQEVRKKLAMKKFLLVLDDVWKKESDKKWEENWEILRNVLLCGAKGSKIIVTTRSNEVADIMGTLPTHMLHALSDDESLSLFNQKAFGVGGGRGDEETEYLAPIAKKIVEKCKGVPLAVKAIRSVLHSKRHEREWVSILNSELWDLPDEKNKILPTLRLSYDHLPSHLKPCFSFCSIFPKDDIIRIDTLIQLWMADGLLQPLRGNMLMEDVGLEYFKELLSSSFFQDEEVNKWGNIIYCKMHDLFHDLALSVSRAECCVLDSKRTEKNISEMRRFRVAFDQETTAMPEALDMATKLRVFFMGSLYFVPKIAIDISVLVKLKSLRVLVLRDLGIKELPHSFVMLKHLRFLDLQNIGIEVLPMWITSLYNLQTIGVRFCHELKQLPSSIEKLINLRHFDIYGNSKCPEIVPKGIGQLKFLQTIPTFRVGLEEGHHITELKHLDHLRGTLKLVNLKNVRSREDAKSANLKQKQGIHELVLKWSNGRGSNNIDGDNERNDDEVWEGLQPHPHLKELKIDGCEGTRFPTWLTHTMLPNLVKIDIVGSLSNFEQLPAFGLFKHLKCLCIFGMCSLKRIGIEFYGAATHSQIPFPSLRVLSLYGLENLEEWVEGPTLSPSSSSTSSYAYPFPLLEVLHILSCPNLRIVPTAFPSLSDLNLSNVTSMVVQMLGRIKLPALTKLWILGISNLTELPQGSLQNKNHLRFLSIYHCPLLQTFNNELQYLTALERLTIGGFSDELSSFRFLDEEEEEEEEAEESSTGAIQQRLPFYNNLRRLNVEGCTLLSLPKRIQHFTALESLRIIDFCNMEALPEWLGNLSSLQFLEIYYCDRLMHLPSAEAMRRLCSLRELYIYSCPCLTKRCAKDQGQEWYKISHIPTIMIDGEYIKWGYDRFVLFD